MTTLPEKATQHATQPLCGHASIDSVLAWSEQGPVTVAQWLADVHALAQTLPASSTHVLNICQNRYHFLVGFGAGMLTGKTSLQPASLAPAALQQLVQHAPHAFCLHDGESPALGDVGTLLPLLDVRSISASTNTQAVTEPAAAIPHIAADQVVAQVFTSGSTGVPVAHAKTWGKLCINARAEAQRLGLDTQKTQTTIVGTVPSQHMYGFESVLLLCLVAGCSLWSGRPFYPADVAQALADTPQPRMLVTTPVHLRALVDADIPYPVLDRLLCATAPLALPLAQEAELRFGAPLYEIYGSTETSQIAMRRTLDGAAWHVFPDVILEQEGDVTWVSGGHVEGRVPLADVIEVVDAGHFILHGRKTDMVNIAGRRSSLAYLNHQLAHVQGVRDGAFFLPPAPTDAQGHALPAVERLSLIACAPDMTPRQVLDALRPYVEPIFLPRPLILVDRMPRNDTGKLPLQALQILYEAHVAHKTSAQQAAGNAKAQTPDKPQHVHEMPMPAPSPAATQWTVPPDHPVFAGHFPGHPVLPGALLLQRCADLWEEAGPVRDGQVLIRNAKFFAPCTPGDMLDFVWTPKAVVHEASRTTVQFTIRRGDMVVANGVLEHVADAKAAA